MLHVESEASDAERYERELLGVYRAAYMSSGLTYEDLRERTGISRAKLVRLLSPSPAGSADLDPADHFRLSRALDVSLVEAVRRAEQRILDESTRANS